MPEFSLNIDLGNAAMQTPDDVAVALRIIANRLNDDDVRCAAIFDLNGNRVGAFKFDPHVSKFIV